MAVKLVPGYDYPNTYWEFMKMFPDDIACSTYLAKLRWPEGFVCPSCKNSSIPWNESRNRLACPICRHQTSVSAGTIFDKTRTPLTTWFKAAWYVTTSKNGMSAKSLEQTMGISYRVAWTMMQRFRVAMVNSERRLLSGKVEVDETLIGAIQHGSKRGRGSNKSIVLIAVETKHPKGLGRIRMRQVSDVSGINLLPFVCDVVVPKSIILTDGWEGYNELHRNGYKRKVTVLTSSGDPAHVSMPGVLRVADLLKRWILVTHQGSISQEHLQSYLEEFTFRFNRRTSKNRGLIFRRLLKQAVATGPVIEKDITHGYNWE